VYKHHVEEERMTIPVSCSVPFSDGFVMAETLIDVKKFKRNPKAKYQETYVKYKKDYKRQAVHCICPTFTAAVPQVFSSSPHNLRCAVQTRALVDVKPGDKEAWDELETLCLGLVDMYDDDGQPRSHTPSFVLEGLNLIFSQERITWEYYISRFPPVKRKKLMQIREKFMTGDYELKHLVYNAFVKKEKQMIVTSKPYKATKPRVIQAAHDLTKWLTGVWFLSYSYALKFCWNPLSWIWFCSGYTTEVFNWWFNDRVSKLGGLGRVSFLVSDFSTYDVTQGKHSCERTVSNYDRLGFTKWINRGKMVLLAKLKTLGFGRGVRYQMPFTQKSGDNDTTTSNTEKTGECVASFFLKFLFQLWCFIAAIGDDNFCIFNEKRAMRTFGSLKKMKRLYEEHCARLGYKAKVLISKNPMAVEFMSCRFYPTKDGCKIGKKPGRVLTKLGWFMATTKSATRTKAEWYAIMRGTIKSYLPTGNHVPFLRVYLQVVDGFLAEYDVKENTDKYLLTGPTIYEADWCTWAAFEAVYGYTPVDEEIFRVHLVESIERYGLSCVIDSPHVTHLFETELIL
jgi:hypothetical protein